MYDLFNPAPDKNIDFSNTSVVEAENNTSIIPGLKYLTNFISISDEKSLINSINSEIWLKDIKRRVQHYGYKYDYKARSIDYSMYLGKLPVWTKTILDELILRENINEIPDQMIVNEYEPGQGIANHIDCEPCFEDTVISVSLGSHCIMEFINIKTNQKVEVLLEPRSVVVISGKARYEWTHGIPARKNDFFNGRKIERKLRISMTFRKVKFKS